MLFGDVCFFIFQRKMWGLLYSNNNLIMEVRLSVAGSYHPYTLRSTSTKSIVIFHRGNKISNDKLHQQIQVKWSYELIVHALVFNFLVSPTSP